MCRCSFFQINRVWVTSCSHSLSVLWLLCMPNIVFLLLYMSIWESKLGITSRGKKAFRTFVHTMPSWCWPTWEHWNSKLEAPLSSRGANRLQCSLGPSSLLPCKDLLDPTQSYYDSVSVSPSGVASDVVPDLLTVIVVTRKGPGLYPSCLLTELSPSRKSEHASGVTGSLHALCRGVVSLESNVDLIGCRDRWDEGLSQWHLALWVQSQEVGMTFPCLCGTALPMRWD